MNQTASTVPFLVATDLGATLGGRTTVAGVAGVRRQGDCACRCQQRREKNTAQAYSQATSADNRHHHRLMGTCLRRAQRGNKQRRAVLRQQIGLGFAFTVWVFLAANIGFTALFAWMLLMRAQTCNRLLALTTPERQIGFIPRGTL